MLQQQKHTRAEDMNHMNKEFVCVWLWLLNRYVRVPHFVVDCVAAFIIQP